LQQDIHIALNLLGSRPIDLAILLQALLGLVGSFELSLASSPASVVIVFTIQNMAGFVFTIGCLAFCLLAITLGIHLHIGVVGGSALVVQKGTKFGLTLAAPSNSIPCFCMFS
jgi:hypothetical protein